MRAAPFLAVLAVLVALAPLAPASAQGAAKTDPKALRAIGLSIAKQLEVLALSGAELEQVLNAVREGVAGKASFDPATMQAPIQELFRARTTAAAEKAAAEAARAGPAFLEKAARAPGAERTASGLVFSSLAPGTGASPSATDTVKVHYRGTLTDGQEFDSSLSRGQPAEFPLNRVIACWTEGVQKMKVGGKARLVCPPSIAYGERGSPPRVPGNAVLVFEVELLEIVK
jgi:FKBP-type peptidyl-prolyl cis-trans isomerase